MSSDLGYWTKQYERFGIDIMHASPASGMSYTVKFAGGVVLARDGDELRRMLRAFDLGRGSPVDLMEGQRTAEEPDAPRREPGEESVEDVPEHGQPFETVQEFIARARKTLADRGIDPSIIDGAAAPPVRIGGAEYISGCLRRHVGRPAGR